MAGGKARGPAHAEQRARQLRERAGLALHGQPDPDRARDQPPRRPRRVQSSPGPDGPGHGGHPRRARHPVDQAHVDRRAGGPGRRAHQARLHALAPGRARAASGPHRRQAGMSASLTRAAATRLLAERLTDQVGVPNLGQASMDLQTRADRPLNCYGYGAMGQCSSLALGIAIARPDVRVIALDGDGSLLMNLGSLCTIAAEAPKNYALVVWDNEVHQTTGGQPTATAGRASLSAIARGADIDKAM